MILTSFYGHFILKKVMTIQQKKYSKTKGWEELSQALPDAPQLVLVFGGRQLLEEGAEYETILSWYPNAHILWCSTAGEIIDTQVSDDSLVLTAIHFEKTTLVCSKAEITQPNQSETVGKQLSEKLQGQRLVHAMVFSDGLHVNGTALVKGILANLPPQVSVTGGLVGDGPNFKKTLVGLDEKPSEGKVVLIGFYGDTLKVGYGSLGGWDPFGPERIITKAKDNVLYELDGQPALALYKKYLGDQAAGLPSSGLLFPLALRLHTEHGDEEVVRTLLAVNEEEQSMTFAGDMPEGTPAKLMKANFERLIDGAEKAAEMSSSALGVTTPQLAILISCIGRKLVLKERTEEELEAVRSRLGNTALTGFYSYGEICPTAAAEKQCQLHNQTMTITTFIET